MKSREQKQKHSPETQLGWLLMGDYNMEAQRLQGRRNAKHLSLSQLWTRKTERSVCFDRHSGHAEIQHNDVGAEVIRRETKGLFFRTYPTQCCRDVQWLTIWKDR